MAVQLFRTRYPLLMNVDGTTYFGAEITDDNTAFVFSGSTFGNDSNPGTRAQPFATITKAITTGKGILHRGPTNENPTFHYGGGFIMSDCGDSYVNGIFTLSYGQGNIYGMRILSVLCSGIYAPPLNIINCVITNLYGGTAINNGGSIRNNLINNLYSSNFSPINAFLFTKNTILNFKNYLTGNGAPYMDNAIMVNSIDIANQYNSGYYPIFRYQIFRKVTSWLWNGTAIPIIYGVNSTNWIQDLRNSITTFANTLDSGTKIALLAGLATMFLLNTTGGESCKVIDDIGDTPIFNRYSGVNPVDYSLLLDANNQALYASSDNDFVGCFSGNVGNMIYDPIKDVDINTGIETANTPDLLALDSTGNFYAVSNSLQYWNRVTTNVLYFARGYSFNGVNSLLKSGINQRFTFGKLQPFSVDNIPVESVEIIPYDSINTPSIFPRFSAKFYGSTQMYYYNSGDRNGQPVLFNDLLTDFAITTNKSLAIYGTWAVTDADSENFEMASQPNTILKSIALVYFKFELNGHYND